MGQPDPERICTSIVERSNLSTRMGLRRFTRLTNAFSKKWGNHWAAVACWFAFYNFCSVHRSLKVTPVHGRGDRLIACGACANYWSRRAKPFYLESYICAILFDTEPNKTVNLGWLGRATSFVARWVLRPPG